MIHLVLLSGGSGSRLWPLSNNARSKQFLKVLRDEDGNHVSMVQRVFAQIQNVPTQLDITIATTESQKYSIESQLPDGDYALVLEPERRDTAPAIMLACAHLSLAQGVNDEDTVVVMPIDTFADQSYYNMIPHLADAVQQNVADLVLLGVEPTLPSEKFGYIVPETPEGELRPVSRFTEKPSSEQAKELIARGALWNCGVFSFKLGYLKEITSSFLALEDFDTFRRKYSDLPKNSFDYEVVEKAQSIAVIPYSGTWKDLGTWNTLTDEMAERQSGRAVGVETCENTYVINELNLPLVVLGMKDSVVIATHDGILVSDSASSSQMKPYVARASEDRPMYEQRRWGEYRVIDSGVYPDGAKSLSKELIIATGKQLSYQRHAHRSEVWTVVSGEGEVVLDGEVSGVSQGDVVNIRPMQMHSVRAIHELHIIEVQLGDMLDEEDIERFGDYWE